MLLLVDRVRPCIYTSDLQYLYVVCVDARVAGCALAKRARDQSLEILLRDTCNKETSEIVTSYVLRMDCLLACFLV